MTLKTSTFCCDYDGNLPETLIIDGCNDIDSGEIKDITGYGVKHIEVINNKNFVTLDDIVYNKTKTTVVACLAEKQVWLNFLKESLRLSVKRSITAKLIL